VQLLECLLGSVATWLGLDRPVLAVEVRLKPKFRVCSLCCLRCLCVPGLHAHSICVAMRQPRDGEVVCIMWALDLFISNNGRTSFVKLELF
jgi:hypothetical protein